MGGGVYCSGLARYVGVGSVRELANVLAGRILFAW